MRCISFLLPIQFGSSIGRSVLISLIIIYVIAGPISNIAANLNESVRVILCQMGTTFSLVKTKYELMFKPLREAFLKLKVSFFIFIINRNLFFVVHRHHRRHRRHRHHRHRLQVCTHFRSYSFKNTVQYAVENIVNLNLLLLKEFISSRLQRLITVATIQCSV